MPKVKKSELKFAKDFEVKEGDPSTGSGQGKKIFILSGGKVWEIGIK